MPIEIRELHIKVSVTPGVGDDVSAPPANVRQRSQEPAPSPAGDVVSECVEQILEILRNRLER